jgi:hypothetical protein
MVDSGMIAAPFFLVGAERSGTSLLRAMLAGHPLLAWSEEFEYAVDFMPPAGGLPDLNEYHRFLESDQVFQFTGHRIDPKLSYPELVNSFLVERRGTKPLVGATVHRHFDRLLRVWPDARFIHIVRDGRDVARSVIECGWASHPWVACDYWIEAETLWERLVKTLPAERHLSLTFESLILGSVQELTRICEFCGVPYDAGLFDYPQSSNYTLPDPRMVGSWQKKMDRRQVQLVEARIGPMLEERGYALSGNPSIQVPPSMGRRFRWQDYLGRVRFRLSRYGLPLLIQDFLTRRLGCEGLQRKVRKRIHAINKQYIK